MIASFEQGFYGSEAGKGRNYLGDKLGEPNLRLGNAWRVAANWSQDKPDGTVVNVSGNDD